MNTKTLALVGALAIALVLGIALQAVAEKTPGCNHKIPQGKRTPDSVVTRIGTLRFIDGQPDEASLLRARNPAGQGGQLDPNRGGQVLVHCLAALRPDRGMVRQVLATGRDRDCRVISRTRKDKEGRTS